MIMLVILAPVLNCTNTSNIIMLTRGMAPAPKKIEGSQIALKTHLPSVNEEALQFMIYLVCLGGGGNIYHRTPPLNGTLSCSHPFLRPDEGELELCGAHTPCAHCTIYRSTFVCMTKYTD